MTSVKEATRGWRKLNNQELHGLQLSQNVINVMKSRKIRWERYVAGMGETRNAFLSLAEEITRKGTWEIVVERRLTL